MQHDSTNTVFSLAADLVNYTSRHLFLTGKAGTGKTTFLKYIKEHTKKNTVIVAPTGVAAINAGGVTMHSLFQLPLGPYLPTLTNNWEVFDGRLDRLPAFFRNRIQPLCRCRLLDMGGADQRNRLDAHRN